MCLEDVMMLSCHKHFLILTLDFCALCIEDL